MKLIFGLIGLALCVFTIVSLMGMLEKYVKNRFVYWTLSIIIFVTMFGLYRVIFQNFFGLN